MPMRERNATPWAWHSRIRVPLPPERLPAGFLDRPAEAVAPDLLGCRIASSIDGRQTVGVIVETEAYVGPHDPASHAAARIGKTARNATMFQAGGAAYVYLSYGIHWCLNVVTGREGEGTGVLIRALDPLEGTDVMAERRGRADQLCSGPGRLGQALGITGDLDGHRLEHPPLRLLPGWTLPSSAIAVSPRIGIRLAADWPLRFHIRGHPSVSKA
jgi:DNA-3-methyladenine glycosylase